MRTIQLVSLQALKPNPRNTHTHSKRQIRQIADSVTAFGFTVPLLIDEQAMIIAGHGRFEAAKLLGLSEVPALVLEGLSEAKKRALLLADNKIAQNAGWDRERLAIELPELAELLIERGSGHFDHRLRARGNRPDPQRFRGGQRGSGRCHGQRLAVGSGGQHAGRPLAARQPSTSVRRCAQWRSPRPPHGPGRRVDGLSRSTLQCAHQGRRRPWSGQAWRVRHGFRRDVAAASSLPFWRKRSGTPPASPARARFISSVWTGAISES